ncbi:OadG family transporter subunit [Roseiflexus castenholzii]|jgi:Na+-transporting methylmalonyl-CoA/oxaloacetate decarboxylase gamma subunit|uniref:Sodium pump decarboxylase gamma subunit n=1 Tax=Roseiflexus castenholzii (strain DSM 13941 / HLO8) TaxID=383372 RepID=A7NHW8_ROSCS|nr:OadG family transporter subunit [Roseiflexus castenholzii]ABU57065.1 sodium pump decarboxylase gamma subunit [Roseiflexus castenholzii DSM 13941]
MPDNLRIALSLLVIGMSITFGALLLLWGLMALLTALTSRSVGETPAAAEADERPSLPVQPDLSKRRRRAAAAAVAIVLAREQAARSVVATTSTVSPWQAAGRMARVGQEGRERL